MEKDSDSPLLSWDCCGTGMDWVPEQHRYSEIILFLNHRKVIKIPTSIISQTETLQTQMWQAPFCEAARGEQTCQATLACPAVAKKGLGAVGAMSLQKGGEEAVFLTLSLMARGASGLQMTCCRAKQALQHSYVKLQLPLLPIHLLLKYCNI